jgi:hypothetical protein
MRNTSLKPLPSFACEVEYFNGWRSTVSVEMVDAPDAISAAEHAERVAAEKANRSFMLHRFFCRRVEPLTVAA